MQTSEEVGDPDLEPLQSSPLQFPVVGIGASAGGISALRRLFEQMPENSGMAFVVVMHLSPDHQSSLAPVLQRATKLPVWTVEAPTPIRPDHVYVIPPAKKLAMSDGHLRVTDLAAGEARGRSVDLFFRSLAQAHRERAVCLVLSGTGGDGSQGLKRIKELGGVSIAQSPEDAEFDGMPRSAVHTGLVDFVLPVAEMPQKLVEIWQNARRMELPLPPVGLRVAASSGDAELLAEEALLSIKALLRERTGHDFSRYKRATVLRRLERRMQVRAMPDLPSYRRLLESEPSETQALLQDMLISVTNFFRDPGAFSALESAVRGAIALRPPGEPFRAWIAGCATGEEAYSVAILLQELLSPLHTPIQVFGSDIDARAVGMARVGVFPASIATDVSAQRLREFFVPDGSEYRIAKVVRDTIVFSTQNVLSDPPFTRMDLICCRNLLIYLDRQAQAQLLRTSHFALKPDGLLFLGSSETTDAVEGMFVAVDKRNRLFMASQVPRRESALPPIPILSRGFFEMPAQHAPQHVPPPRPALEALHARVLANHAPATVLVDADDTALHVDERAAHLLRLPGGAPTNKLMALARPELRADLRAALALARETGKTVAARPVRLEVNGQPRFLSISVKPALDESPDGLFLVVLDESQETMLTDGHAGAKDPLVDTLEAELTKAHIELRSTRGESAASTEALRASNEELQTINEELRSTSEELETSKEELQAVNEELTTVNAELSLKIEETSKSNDDLQNLMVSAEIGAVFVDRDMKVKRFTPQAATLFNLLRADVGRPLLDITHRLDYPQLSLDATDVLGSLRRVEREMRSADGRWFLARALPYRTADDRIEGVVFTFFDVSARRAAEEQLRLSEQRMRLVADSMRDYIIVTMDKQGIVATWSPGAERVLGFAALDAIGKPFDFMFTAEDRLAEVPTAELRRARDDGRAEDDRWHVRQDGERIFCSGITTPLWDGATLVGFAKIARDFTSAELRDKHRDAALAEERAARDRMQQASVMKDEFLAVMSHELKNPLAVIEMSAQLLTRMPAVGEEPRAARATQAIKSAVASQAQIINDLLELSRVNTGKVVLAPVAVDLPQVVRGIVDALGPDLAAKGQTLELKLPESVTVLADPVRVEQIVWNLLTNAVKFTPERGDIRISLDTDDVTVKLTVADSGIGIEPRLLGEVFEMFRQVETGPSRKKTGLGIGLALVKQLALLHGGRAEATSDGVGRGAEFHVWLPIAERVTKDDALAADASQEVLKGLRILLVDDEPDLLEMFYELLTFEGAKVTTAGGASLALDAVRTEKFDLIISDIAMPDRDGYWLATELRRTPESRHLPIVAVSGMSRAADQDKAIASGFDVHVGKPLEVDQLRAAIVTAISLRSANSSPPPA